MPGLSLQKLIEVLVAENMPSKPRELKRLSIWIEGILRSRGEAYLRENRIEILRQWERFIKEEFKNCV